MQGADYGEACGCEVFCVGVVRIIENYEVKDPKGILKYLTVENAEAGGETESAQ